MPEMIAYCGLNCEQCPAFIAKQTNDQALREKTAKEWSGGGYEVTADQLNCDGCHASENNYFHCTQCTVRNCGIEKGLTTCADCRDYPCAEKLEALWKQLSVPHAKETLDKLHN